MKLVFSLQSTLNSLNLYAEVGRSVRSKKIQKVNKLKNHHWSVQNWKHLLKCYSIAQIHHKTALVAVHQKRAAHRQPGGFIKPLTLYVHFIQTVKKKICLQSFWMLCEKFVFAMKAYSIIAALLLITILWSFLNLVDRCLKSS